MDDKLRAYAEVGAAGAAEPRRIDEAGADRADHAADAVDAERVERVVIDKLRLQDADRVEADDRSHRAKHERAERAAVARRRRSEEHTSELQSLMRISYAVFCLIKKKTTKIRIHTTRT